MSYHYADSIHDEYIKEQEELKQRMLANPAPYINDIIFKLKIRARDYCLTEQQRINLLQELDLILTLTKGVNSERF